MNALQKNNIKSVFKYTWPLYIVIAVLVTLIINSIFTIIHQIPSYQTLTIFITGEVSDSNSLKSDLLEKFKDKGLKKVSTIDVYDNDVHYNTQLSINGYNSADILIIPKTKLESLSSFSFALELDEELYDTYEVYEKESVKYGIQIDKEKVKKYMNLTNEVCYMVLNGNSSNIGKYALKPNEERDNALTLIKDWGKHA